MADSSMGFMPETGISEEHTYDVAHMYRLSTKEQIEVNDEAAEFLQRMKQQFTQTYLHLDLAEVKLHTRKPVYEWKVLLLTNAGKYSAKGTGFGASETLKKVLGALEIQVNRRLAKISVR